MPNIDSLYQELRGWQSGIAALIGFLALLFGALFNFRLNRRRDAAIRHDEMMSVATALYGEILLMREDIARLARIVAKKRQRESEIDLEFVQANKLRDPILYPALASKLGMLPAELVMHITRFHENFQKAKEDLPLLVEDKERGFSYSVLTVLEPAVAAVNEVRPALRKIELLAGVPEAAQPDLGWAEAVIEFEREAFEIPTPPVT
jgi:hypothetical protein